MVDWQKEHAVRRMADLLWNFSDRLFKVLFWIAAAALFAVLHAKTGIAALGWVSDALGFLIIATVTFQILSHVLEWSETRIETQHLSPLIQTVVVIGIVAIAATGMYVLATTITDVVTTVSDTITVAKN